MKFERINIQLFSMMGGNVASVVLPRSSTKYIKTKSPGTPNIFRIFKFFMTSELTCHSITLFTL